MGKIVSKGQINVLRRNNIKKIYLGLDPDAAEELNLLLKELNGEFALYNLVPDGKVDLGSLSFGEVYQRFCQAPRINPGQFFLFLKDQF